MTTLALLLGISAICWILLQGHGNRLIFARSRTFRAEKEDTKLDVEDVEFCADDGAALHGWWFHQRNAKGILLVCHGNAGNVADRIWVAEDLQDIPLHVFIFDYRGYGKSKGVPSEAGTEKDVAAAWEFARSKWREASDSPPIFIYGRSLGGAVALQAAAKFPIRGLILESTFTSILAVGMRNYPWLLPRVTCRHPYRSDLRITAVKAPVIMAHSPDDEVIPFDMGEALYRRVPNPEGFFQLSGTHDEAGWQTSPVYAQGVRDFIDRNL